MNDIEIMIAPHPDAYHLGRLDEVLKAYKVESIYAPKVEHTTGAYANFLKEMKAEKLTIKTTKGGVKLPLKTVTAKFVGPTRDYGKTDLNNWSAVLHVTYNKNKFLLTGEAELGDFVEIQVKQVTVLKDETEKRRKEIETLMEERWED